MFMVFVNKLNVIVCKDRKMQQNPDELLPFLEKIKKIRAEGNNKKVPIIRRIISTLLSR